MNLLLITETLYPSQFGGPSNTIYWHAKALTNAGENVSVIATAKGIKSKHNIPIGQWICTEYGNVIYCKDRFASFSQGLRNINKYDVVHLSSLFYYPSLLLALFLFAKRKTIVWSPRGECSETALKFSAWKKKPVLKIIKAISGKIIFHATSAKEGNEIRKVFGDVKMVEIPNYLYLEKKLNIPIKKQLLFLGRIHPIKALENLIEAFAISQKNSIDKYDLHIAGSPEGNEEYMQKLKDLVVALNLVDRVYFIDHIDGAAKQKELAESKCLILPSCTENFGNVVIEALNQGTPVIASANTPWQVLESRSAGYHVSNEPAELAKAINRLTGQSESSYVQMRINAYDLCKDQFSITDNIYKWTDIYNDLYYKT